MQRHRPERVLVPVDWGGKIVEIVTEGEQPDDLHVEQVRRISAAAAVAVYRSGCDRSDRPDTPCPL